jgi:hypothetical protein
MVDQNKQVYTLQQLEEISFITREGDPATIYQIAFRPFNTRADEALVSAEAGDFSKIEALIPEVAEMIRKFADHLSFLEEQKAILSDPTGPEAMRLNEIEATAQANYRKAAKGKKS